MQYLSWTCRLLLFFGIFLTPIAHGQEDPSYYVSAILRQKLGGQYKQPLTVEGENLYGSGVLQQYYSSRNYHPLWIQGSAFQSRIESFVTALEKLKNQGISLKLYHHRAIRKLLQESTNDPQVNAMADLDLLLTKALFTLSNQYRSGAVNTDPDYWTAFLNHQFVTNNNNAFRPASARWEGEEESTRVPESSSIDQLYHNLIQYQKIEEGGGWPKIRLKQRLQVGDENKQIGILRTILHRTGDLVTTESIEPNYFDAGLEEALVRFQKRHGIVSDGVLGGESMEALNVPVEKRICQIAVNIDRMKSVAPNLEYRHILINIPDFKLHLVENEQSVMVMNTILGRPDRPTPQINSMLTHIITSPHWYVPRSIAIKDKLPLIQQDPNFLTEKGFKLYAYRNGQNVEISPYEIDWANITPENFPVSLVQNPGDANALGLIKFVFPNPHDVFMHDTPEKHFFQQSTRAFSSGCIRIQRPVDLAQYLLQSKPEWTRETIEASMNEGTPKTIKLDNPIPIHVVYITAWVDGENQINFRKDIYGRDGCQ